MFVLCRLLVVMIDVWALFRLVIGGCDSCGLRYCCWFGYISVNALECVLCLCLLVVSLFVVGICWFEFCCLRVWCVLYFGLIIVVGLFGVCVGYVCLFVFGVC